VLCHVVVRVSHQVLTRSATGFGLHDAPEVVSGHLCCWSFTEAQWSDRRQSTADAYTCSLHPVVSSRCSVYTAFSGVICVWPGSFPDDRWFVASVRFLAVCFTKGRCSQVRSQGKLQSSQGELCYISCSVRRSLGCYSAWRTVTVLGEGFFSAASC
jgi:hypothetical protein